MKKEIFNLICKDLGISFPFENIKFGFFLDEGEFDPVKNTIKIDNCDWAVNLAHELRHVWQIQTGKLTVDRRWNGVKVIAPYGTEPWELDAKQYSQKYRK